MKKLICALSVSLLTTAAFAGTTANLLLTGTVPKKLDISIDQTSVSLDLTATRSNFGIANVREKSNSNTGYKVTIQSSNLGALKRVSGTETFSYSLRYGGSNLTSQSSLGGDTIVMTTSPGVHNIVKPLEISYTGVLAEDMVEGTYEDTLTFTIAAN